VNDAGYLRYLSAIVYEMAGEKEMRPFPYFKTVQAYGRARSFIPRRRGSYNGIFAWAGAVRMISKLWDALFR
jgi:hypothetical protein